ncbi:cysteine--tRNA ligase [Patescibacteria group bacterium]
MALKIYNTLTSQKEVFQPMAKGKVSMYTCGPTVYFFAHIGNFATFVREDFIRRYLEYKGYEVRQIMNITDVGHLTDDDANTETGEDKIVKAAKREKKTPAEITKFYADKFFDDAKKLNIEAAHKYPKATQEISGIIELVKDLIQKNFAYEVKGNVFFDILKFKDYGKLSGKTPDKITTGLRLEPHPDKKNPSDFALWLKAPEGHLMQWDSPWGKGYPGWHIECSEMAMKYLAETIDIHIGGEDHLFPHHENEIAQSEAATGKPFANYWMHTKHILVNGAKMSKSKNNFYTLDDVEKKGFAAPVFRFWLFTGHYRSQADFSWEALTKAKNKLNRLIDFKERISNIKGANKPSQKAAELIKETKEKFTTAMDDDFNTPQALDQIFIMIKEANTLVDAEELGIDEAQKFLKLLEQFDRVLAVLNYQPEAKVDPAKIDKLILERDQARDTKDFARADEIRDELDKFGIEIKDSPQGTIWRSK